MPNITLYGTYWCSDCRRSKRFLSEQQIAYNWVDIEHDGVAQAQVEKINNGKRIVPTIVFEDGSFAAAPSNAALAHKLGIVTQHEHTFHDVTIVGSGPAGMTTAIYNARDGFSVLVIDEGALGGQASTTSMLENVPGFPDGISGGEWGQRVVTQARRFGVEFLQAQSVAGLEQRENSVWVKTGDGKEYGSRTVLIATGADYRRMGVKGEDELTGAGVHYCSTCDGPFYKGKSVTVVGGGNSAVEESLGLLRFVTDVTLLVRGDKLKASRVAIDKLNGEERVKVRYNSVVKSLEGAGKLSTIQVRDLITDAEETIATDGLFVFIGQQPNSGFLRNSGVLLDAFGFVVTGHQLAWHAQWQGTTPEMMATSVPGVFAAGDVRAGSTKQIASACGEGATAALQMREYLNEH